MGDTAGSSPNHIFVEGLDRLGKDTLVKGILNRCGYYQLLHYGKPERLICYSSEPQTALHRYQEATFRTLFLLLRGAPNAKVICNRAHLGECVYAPIYRKYRGDYVFDLEREFAVHEWSGLRLILLAENFDISRHFVDDERSLGGPEKRPAEQTLFFRAFEASVIRDKRIIYVTDPETGGFRTPEAILDEALA